MQISDGSIHNPWKDRAPIVDHQPATRRRPFTLPHFQAWAADLILDTGEPWSLEPFQQGFVRDLFEGWPECWLIVPEGNGKTTLLAGLALYHAESRPFAVVPVAAASREQAEIMYRQAEGFVLRSPVLHEPVPSDIQRAKGKRKTEAPRFACMEGYRRIVHHGGGRIQIFASDDRTADGIIPTLGIIDELHRQRDLSLYRTWSGKLLKRDGQIAAISTAGEPGSDFEMTRSRIIETAETRQRRGAFTRVTTGRVVLHEWALAADADPTDIRVEVWAGRPFVLEPWQREFVWEALEIDPTTGLRIYAEVGLGLPRKNGKSLLASAFGHYFLVADGEAEPEVYIAVAARGQAGIVLGQARRIGIQSPRLRRLVRVQTHLIECPRNGGIMRALSADAALQHGLNPSANIIDELHAHRDGVWRTANPASRLQDGKELGKEYARLRARGALTEWRTYHLDQFVESLEVWMPPDDWDARSGDPVFKPSIPTYAAVRIAHDHRSAAVAVAQRQGEQVVLRVKSFPRSPLPEGAYVLAEPIEEHIVDLRKRYPARVTAEVRYRPDGKVRHRPRPGPLVLHHGAFFEPSRQRLEKHAVVTMDVPSTSERITPAAATLMQLVTSGALVHDGESELDRQTTRVVAKQRPKGWAIESGTGEPIVAAQAAMLAVHWAMTSQAPVSRRVRGL